MDTAALGIGLRVLAAPEIVVGAVIGVGVVVGGAIKEALDAYELRESSLEEVEPVAVAEARRQFTALGFDVGPGVGTSFSLSAPRERFEQVFHVPLTEDLRSLPLSALPPALRQVVASVVLPPPPDFGPTSFGP